MSGDSGTNAFIGNVGGDRVEATTLQEDISEKLVVWQKSLNKQRLDLSPLRPSNETPKVAKERKAKVTAEVCGEIGEHVKDYKTLSGILDAIYFDEGIGTDVKCDVLFFFKFKSRELSLQEGREEGKRKGHIEGLNAIRDDISTALEGLVPPVAPENS